MANSNQLGYIAKIHITVLQLSKLKTFARSEMSNSTTLGIAFAIVICNGIIGHFFPPSGITWTPIVIVLTTMLVCFKTKNIKPFPLSILVYFFIALNDILIKLYAGGSHDIPGLGWILISVFI